MRLVSLEEQVRWTEGSEQVVNRNTANLTLAKGLQLSISQTSPASALSFKLSGKGWTLRHDSPMLDTLASWQHPLLGGKLEVTQAVPGGRWFLVPTPAFKFSRTFANPHALDRLSCTWDSLLRRGQLSQAMYCGTDCAYKAGLQLDTLLARAQLPLPGLKLRADARLRPRVLAAQAKAVPYFMGPAPPVSLTLDVTAPWGDHAGAGKRRAAAVLGINWRM